MKRLILVAALLAVGCTPEASAAKTMVRACQKLLNHARSHTDSMEVFNTIPRSDFVGDPMCAYWLSVDTLEM